MWQSWAALLIKRLAPLALLGTSTSSKQGTRVQMANLVFGLWGLDSRLNMRNGIR